MLMLKYKCPLCGRIHYGREGLKAGYCTTCGPKGKLMKEDGVSEEEIVEVIAEEILNETGRTMSGGKFIMEVSNGR